METGEEGEPKVYREIRAGRDLRDLSPSSIDYLESALNNRELVWHDAFERLI